MSFSAIIPAVDLDAANAALEAEGFGPGNFSVPLWRAGDPDPDSYGLNASGEAPVFKAACEALANVSVQSAPPGAVGFDTHVEALGLSRTDPGPAPAPVPTKRRKK
jgi:hypothetical protein